MRAIAFVGHLNEGSRVAPLLVWTISTPACTAFLWAAEGGIITSVLCDLKGALKIGKAVWLDAHARYTLHCRCAHEH